MSPSLKGTVKSETRVLSTTKNPNRVAAGRLNRSLRSPLNELSRQKLKAAALANKPWKHATGPRTEAGKKRVSGNARKPECCPENDRPADQTLVNARALLEQTTALRREYYLDMESIQIKSADSIADQLHAVIVGASHMVTHELSASLLASTAVGDEG